MTRNAFKMKLKPGCVEEYKKRHDQIWSQLAETRKCLEDLGPEGYLPCSCHFAQADTPIKNIVTLIETVQQYRL